MVQFKKHTIIISYSLITIINYMIIKVQLVMITNFIINIIIIQVITTINHNLLFKHVIKFIIIKEAITLIKEVELLYYSFFSYF